MPLPTERQLLEAWESAPVASAMDRADVLLALARPDISPEALTQLPLGERERALLELRRSLLGPHMAALAACPRCGERHDVEFDIDALLDAFPARAPVTVRVRHGGLTLTVRTLTVGDQDEVARLPEGDDVARALFARCVVAARRGKQPVDPGAITAGARAAVAQALATADPLCQLSTDLACAGCGERWTVQLDTAAYLWRELHDWAEGVLWDVHTLARAYGWTEDDVLRLSPRRRALYVSLAGG